MGSGSSTTQVVETSGAWLLIPIDDHYYLYFPGIRVLFTDENCIMYLPVRPVARFERSDQTASATVPGRVIEDFQYCLQHSVRDLTSVEQLNHCCGSRRSNLRSEPKKRTNTYATGVARIVHG